MSFGPHTTLTLMVDACATLPEVRILDVTRRVSPDIKEKVEREKERAEDDEEKAFNELQKVIPSLSQTPNQETIDRRKKNYVESANKAKEAREKYNHLIAQDQKDNEKLRPNPFVTVTLDEDVQSGVPIAFTKTYRGDRRPFWHESFQEIPIGLLAHGKWGHQLLLSSSPQLYSPTRINFWIYHDIGDDKDQSEDSWKRETPKRDLLIGRACLNFGSLVCSGCETWHELPVLDVFENPISNCKLRVKTKLHSALSLRNPVVIQRPLNFPGGIVCGKAGEVICGCGNDCGGVCTSGSSSTFEKPSRKQKCCKAKKRKCRASCCYYRG